MMFDFLVVCGYVASISEGGGRDNYKKYYVYLCSAHPFSFNVYVKYFIYISVIVLLVLEAKKRSKLD